MHLYNQCFERVKMILKKEELIILSFNTKINIVVRLAFRQSTENW